MKSRILDAMCKTYYAAPVKDYLPQIQELSNVTGSRLLYRVNDLA